ncbi:hypothetical protein LCGC14_2722090, partial [marine sediment metagenome]
LKLAKTLKDCPEIEIAEAFFHSQKGDKSTALSILAGIDLPLSRTAALMIVAYHESPQEVVDWLKTADIAATDCDADGKHFLLTCYFELALWDAAIECLGAVTDDDFRETPTLHQSIALTHLIRAVPRELRSLVLNQLPLELASFPLAADAAGLQSRKTAHHYFVKAAQIAGELSCPCTATISDEYALWLELRDPDTAASGRQRLEVKLRDPGSALRFVYFGREFGIKLDIEAIECEIKRQVALNGGMTADASLARFALAFTQKTPEDVANYIAQYRADLVEHLNKKSMQLLEVEMLLQAGLPERANECLDVLVQEGLSEVEESRLRQIIAETKEANPVAARKVKFKKTNSLSALASLVDELEVREEWEDLCEYGEILFDRTHALHDAKRLANALAKRLKSERLVDFLRANTTILAQSKYLQMLYCWALY